METLLWEAQKVFVRRVDEKEKQKVKLMVFTVDQVVRQRVGDRGRKVSGEVRPRMEGRGRETKEWQARKATCVTA